MNTYCGHYSGYYLGKDGFKRCKSCDEFIDNIRETYDDVAM